MRVRAQLAKLFNPAAAQGWSMASAFDHFLLHTGGRGILDELEKELSLAPDQARACRLPSLSPCGRSLCRRPSLTANALIQVRAQTMAQLHGSVACTDTLPDQILWCVLSSMPFPHLEGIGSYEVLEILVWRQVAPARATLHRFGNTSAASTWCALARAMLRARIGCRKPACRLHHAEVQYMVLASQCLSGIPGRWIVCATCVNDANPYGMRDNGVAQTSQPGPTRLRMCMQVHPGQHRAHARRAQGRPPVAARLWWRLQVQQRRVEGAARHPPAARRLGARARAGLGCEQSGMRSPAAAHYSVCP